MSRVPAAVETFTFYSGGVSWLPNIAYKLAIRPINFDQNNPCSYYTFAGIANASSTWIMPANGATRKKAAQINRIYSPTEPTWAKCSSTPLDFSQ